MLNSELLAGLKMPKFEMDANGNIRFNPAFKLAIDISPVKSKHDIVLEGAIQMIFKAKIEKKQELIFKVTGVEIGQVKILNWKGEEFTKFEDVL